MLRRTIAISERRIPRIRTRDIETAKQFGILERCLAFEKDLLAIEDVVPDKHDDGVPFDLSGFYDDLFQVVIVPKYAIRAYRDDYWEARKRLKRRVIALAKEYDLHRTEDRIEDHGEHGPRIMKTSNASVSAVTRSQTFAAVGRAAKSHKVDSRQLLSVLGKKKDDVPAPLVSAWITAHDIMRNYKKANARKAEAAMASTAP